MIKYKVIDHPSDIGIEAYGKFLSEAFENAAFGMFDLMYDIKKVAEKQVIDVMVEADGREKLLVDFLSELIYSMDVNKMAYKKCKVIELSDTLIKAQLYGEAIDLSRHKFRHYIKAMTYSQLLIEENAKGSKIRIIFDI